MLKQGDCRFYRTHFRRGLAKAVSRPARIVWTGREDRPDAYNLGIEMTPLSVEEQHVCDVRCMFPRLAGGSGAQVRSVYSASRDRVMRLSLGR